MRLLSTAMFFVLVGLAAPTAAQETGRAQDGFYSGQSNGQSNGQYNGQVDERVDGRGSHSEGLPPSAADKSNRTFDNPLNANDCAEVNALAPNARPAYQARVQDACQQ
jgi:hypothetical protein